MSEAIGRDVDFEIDDALSKLERLRLVERTARDRFCAVPIDQALLRLDEDWDSYFNKEPYYKPFRDMDLPSVCQAAGFSPERYVQFIIPSRYLEGDAAIDKVLDQQGAEADENTGRLSDSIQWFCFGAWKT